MREQVLKREATESADLYELYRKIRGATEAICAPLETEDYVVQPVVDVSPPKWHIGHSTWFFETFLLKPHLKGYREFDPSYPFVFNSYYETLGARVIRTDRGNLSRPTVEDIYRYRAHVDEAMGRLLQTDISEIQEVLLIGLNHEQQHQELLITDIKYILGHNPLLPAYGPAAFEKVTVDPQAPDIKMAGGIYRIGYTGNGFCFDNELAPHDVYLAPYTLSGKPVTNGEFIDFIADKGYQDFRHWHSEAWDWVKRENIVAPMYWQFTDGAWQHYTLGGLREVDKQQPVCHISYFEACAYAAWAGSRLPTEFEWEAAAGKMQSSGRWEWTGSAYLPYPGYVKAKGAIGEYNGKFMVNQMVLRGSSVATPAGHSRNTYRNFFHPHLRWQYSGLRLCHPAA